MGVRQHVPETKMVGQRDGQTPQGGRTRQQEKRQVSSGGEGQ